MKQAHYPTLKLNSLYSLLIIGALAVVLWRHPEGTLAISFGLLVLYVFGNGILHKRHHTLHRDAIIEYILVSIVVLVLLVSALR